jgi:hypothetical protein
MPTLDNAHALVVGIANYQHVRKLPAVQDAADVLAVLTDPDRCGYRPENVRRLLEGEATQAALRRELADLARRSDGGSTVFFYFSGHGEHIESGPAAGQYLLPVDTVCRTEADLARTAVSGAELTQVLRDIPARKVVVVLDCCHSAGIGQPKDLNAPELRPGLAETFYEDALKTGQGRVIFASCDRGELAYVFGGARNGLFTQHLLDGLRGGVVSEDGYVCIFDLFEYLQPRVTKECPGQHPILKCEIRENFAVALHQGGRKDVVPKDEEGFRYDAYVSYVDREPDATWVWDTFVPRAAKAGVRVAVSGGTGDPGVPRLVNIERAFQQSKRIVVVLSPAYLANRMAEFEHLRAAMLGIERGEFRLLPIKIQAVEEEKLPGWLSMLTMLDFTHRRYGASELDRLVEALRGPLPRW